MIKKAFRPTRLKKRVFDPQKVSIEDIRLPDVINELGEQTVISITKEEISTFKSLDYKNKSLETLEHNAYHSFQIGVILKYLQLDIDLFTPNAKEIFPEFIQKFSLESLQSKVFNIIALYDKKIKKDMTQIQLTNDIEWTPLDAAYLLYYLCIYKK